MKKIITTFLSILLITFLLPKNLIIHSYGLILLLAIVLSILNTIIKPILKVILFPINLITFGAFKWLVNVLVLWIATSLVPGITIVPIQVFNLNISNFLTLVLLSTAINMVQTLIAIFVK